MREVLSMEAGEKIRVKGVAGKTCEDKSCDLAAQEIIAVAQDKSIETAWDRFEEMIPQCGFGELGICCRNCLQGPCRIDPFGGKPDKGICGARDYTIVARNVIRMIAGGAAAHSGHGRHIAETVVKMLEGKTPAYRVKDEEKLVNVAKRLGIETDGVEVKDLAWKVVDLALEDFSRYKHEFTRYTTSTITEKRIELWSRLGVMPTNIEQTISDVMHRTTMGCDADPVPVLFGGIRCAIADLTGEQISTDLSDILFGTPHLVRTQANLGCLDASMINIAVHGHNPVLSDVIVDVAREMDDEAKEAGAEGINIVGICCTGNETLMRKGVPMASNFASQELVLATGVVDLIVADYQCIMPSLSEICSCLPTSLVTTMSNVRLPNDTHVQFREEDAETSARAIIRQAIKSFKERDHKQICIPDIKNEVIAGFSLEQIEELCEKFEDADPLMHVVNKIKDGTIRGICLMAGCNNQTVQHDYNHVTIAEELLKNDVLLIATGCSAAAFAKRGMMSPDAAEKYAGEGLRSFLKELSEANGVDLPPVWHMGSCVDNSRAANFATQLAERLGVDVHEIPFAASAPEANHEKAVAIGTWAVAMGMPVHVGTINYIYGSSLVTEILENTARDVYGGYFIFERHPKKAAEKLLNTLEYRRWVLGLDHEYVREKRANISQERLYEMAIEGAIIAAGYADQLLGTAIEKYGYDQPIEYPETGYELPSIYAWDGRKVQTLGDLPGALGDVRGKIKSEPTLENALIAGEVTMISAEIIEALRYIEDGDPYEGTPYCGFVPDRVLRELGIAFVDDTIPGAAVLVGTADDPKKLVKVVRDCQNKGMLIIATFDTIRQLRDENIQMGLDIMLYPVGEFTQAIHGLNFAIRAALSFGGVQRGDRERLYKYLSKRPKVFVLQMGPIDHIKAAAEFAVMFNGSPTITDQDVDEIPDWYVVEKDYEKLIQKAIEVRNIQVKLAPVDIPVAYGPAFEGETVRRPQTFIEAGGAAKTTAFELLKMRPENEVEDGKITVIGKDVDEMEEGSSTPLTILVEVYGKKMQEDFESVLERRIHQFINFGEGCWHTGQRNILWVRLSKSSVAAGLRFKHFGDILITKIKEDFGNIVSRVQVTIITDEDEIKKRMPEALITYEARDARIAGLTDDAVDIFYTCTLCQSFAPDHVCVVTPERLGLCGAINWMDARASNEITPTGPNQPIVKGETIDEEKGQWTGVNEAVYEHSHHKLSVFNAYTMMEDPMTSCGCFECIVAMTADMQAVIVVNREFPGMTPIGMKFSTLAGSVGGGKQTPGFIGVGRKYITSKKFIPADGGFLRIAWMPKELKETLMNDLKARADELGVPDFIDKIADETICTDAEGLMEWMIKVDHPAIHLPPLLS
jgi:carbon-monoxide dehydrogenase catalytic subunit/CO dehydrogenase/CO-methylating acetyl-CoA synthase complex beta subunit